MSEPARQRTYEELLAICTRLEAETGHQLLVQHNLNLTKGRVDRELMRFKLIQAFIVNALEVESSGEFFSLALEAIIEAFEYEVALVLRYTPDGSQFVATSEFGFDDPPGMLPFSTDWIDLKQTCVVGAADPLIQNWSELNLAQAIVSPLHDKSDRITGVILAGITHDNADFFESITDEHVSAYAMMVRQAGALWINHELNEEIQSHNERLVTLTDSYSRFVPFQFLELLNRDSIEEIGAGDSTALDMSVLFADIRGFTTMSEQMGPSDAFAMLNEFLSVVEPVIEGEQGFVNQYHGDGIMALFPGEADAALRCASAMLKEADALNTRRRSRNVVEIRFGLGINSGPLMLGAIGGGQRLDSSVVGDTANLASRTENLTKLYGALIVFTEHTKDRLKNAGAFSIRELDHLVVAGREGATTVCELMDADPPDVKSQKQETLAQFERGLEHYRTGEFSPALKRFEACVALAPKDMAAALYVQRCRDLIETPPQTEWQGLTVLDRK